MPNKIPYYDALTAAWFVPLWGCGCHTNRWQQGRLASVRVALTLLATLHSADGYFLLECPATAPRGLSWNILYSCISNPRAMNDIRFRALDKFWLSQVEPPLCGWVASKLAGRATTCNTIHCVQTVQHDRLLVGDRLSIDCFN